MEIFAGLVRFVVFNADSRERKEKERGRREAGVRDGAGLVLGRLAGLARAGSAVLFFFFYKLFPFFFSLFLKLKIKTGQNFL